MSENTEFKNIFIDLEIITGEFMICVSDEAGNVIASFRLVDMLDQAIEDAFLFEDPTSRLTEFKTLAHDLTAFAESLHKKVLEHAINKSFSAISRTFRDN